MCCDLFLSAVQFSDFDSQLCLPTTAACLADREARLQAECGAHCACEMFERKLARPYFAADSFIVEWWSRILDLPRYISPHWWLGRAVPSIRRSYGFVDSWVIGHFLGSIFLALVVTVFNILEVNPYWQNIIVGAILVFIVSLDAYLVTKRKKALGEI